MNGIEASKALSTDAETRCTPVIAVTASAVPEDRNLFEQAAQLIAGGGVRLLEHQFAHGALSLVA